MRKMNDLEQGHIFPPVGREGELKKLSLVSKYSYFSFQLSGVELLAFAILLIFFPHTH